MVKVECSSEFLCCSDEELQGQMHHDVVSMYMIDHARTTVWRKHNSVASLVQPSSSRDSISQNTHALRAENNPHGWMVVHSAPFVVGVPSATLLSS